MDIAAIQSALADQDLDGWLLYDFRGSNPIARSVIGFDEGQIGTRRWFYLVPRCGEPVAILHVIEPHAAKGAPGKVVLYRSWKELESLLAKHLAGMKRVAVEYSPGAAIPTSPGGCRHGGDGPRRGARGRHLGGPRPAFRGALDPGAEVAPRSRRRRLPRRQGCGIRAGARASRLGRQGHRERSAVLDLTGLRGARPSHPPPVHRRRERPRVRPAFQDERRTPGSRDQKGDLLLIDFWAKVAAIPARCTTTPPGWRTAGATCLRRCGRSGRPCAARATRPSTS